MKFGVHSEIGKLNKVIVSRPSLAHDRLTPRNCEELLFDDVIWVEQARKDHAEFCSLMRERGVEVYDIQDLLAEAIASDPAARAFLLDRLITPNMVGLGFSVEMRAWLDEMDAKLLARHMLGGIIFADLPKGMIDEQFGDLVTLGDFILPAIPKCAIPARPVLLDFQRRHDEPDVLARAQAGNPDHADGLPVPQDVQERRVRVLVGRQ